MPRTAVDMVGGKYGRLTPLKRTANDGAHAAWMCTCDCGRVEVVVRGDLMRKGMVRSCGCLGTEARKRVAPETGRRNRTHGESISTGDTAEYRTWCSMLRRCYTPSATSYPRYGALGIQVCDRWRSSYVAFLGDMGRRPSDGHSIDRMDPSGNYEPKNCRWATRQEQARNKRWAKHA